MRAKYEKCRRDVLPAALGCMDYRYWMAAVANCVTAMVSWTHTVRFSGAGRLQRLQTRCSQR